MAEPVGSHTYVSPLIWVLLAWVVASLAYTILIRRKNPWPVPAQDARYHDSWAQATFKHTILWQIAVVSVTPRDLIIGWHPLISAVYWFGAGKPVVIPRASIRHTRFVRWFIRPGRVLEVEYESNGEVAVVQIAAYDVEKLMSMLAKVEE